MEKPSGNRLIANEALASARYKQTKNNTTKDMKKAETKSHKLIIERVGNFNTLVDDDNTQSIQEWNELTLWDTTPHRIQVSRPKISIRTSQSNLQHTPRQVKLNNCTQAWIWDSPESVENLFHE